MSPTTANGNHLSQVARQDAETIRLFGVDFLPVNLSPTTSLTQIAAPAPPPPPPPPVQIKTPPATNQSARAAELAHLQQRHNAHCPHCTVATTHTQTVFGEGNPCAEIMFI